MPCLFRQRRRIRDQRLHLVGHAHARGFLHGDDDCAFSRQAADLVQFLGVEFIHGLTKACFIPVSS